MAARGAAALRSFPRARYTHIQQSSSAIEIFRRTNVFASFGELTSFTNVLRKSYDASLKYTRTHTHTTPSVVIFANTIIYRIGKHHDVTHTVNATFPRRYVVLTFHYYYHDQTFVFRLIFHSSKNTKNLPKIAYHPYRCVGQTFKNKSV